MEVVNELLLLYICKHFKENTPHVRHYLMVQTSDTGITMHAPW